MNTEREIQQAFAATGVPYAATAWTTVAATLDRYAAEWREAHRDTCRATEVRHEQSERLLDLRMMCLDQRLGELGALSDLFAAADAEVVALMNDLLTAALRKEEGSAELVEAFADEEDLLRFFPAARPNVRSIRSA